MAALLARAIDTAQPAADAISNSSLAAAAAVDVSLPTSAVPLAAQVIGFDQPQPPAEATAAVGSNTTPAVLPPATEIPQQPPPQTLPSQRNSDGALECKPPARADSTAPALLMPESGGCGGLDAADSFASASMPLPAEAVDAGSSGGWQATAPDCAVGSPAPLQLRPHTPPLPPPQQQPRQLPREERLAPPLAASAQRPSTLLAAGAAPTSAGETRPTAAPVNPHSRSRWPLAARGDAPGHHGPAGQPLGMARQGAGVPGPWRGQQTKGGPAWQDRGPASASLKSPRGLPGQAAGVERHVVR